MADISQLLNPGGRDTPPPLSVLRGIITRAPLSDTDSLHVSVPSYALDLSYEVPAGQWVPRGASLPAYGTFCVLLIDSDGDAWLGAYDGTNEFGGGGGGGAEFPPGGDPGEVLTWVGPGPDDVAWKANPAGMTTVPYNLVIGTGDALPGQVVVNNSNPYLVTRLSINGFDANGNWRPSPLAAFMTGSRLAIRSRTDGKGQIMRLLEDSRIVTQSIFAATNAAEVAAVGPVLPGPVYVDMFPQPHLGGAAVPNTSAQWSNSWQYGVGDIVIYNGVVYSCWQVPPIGTAPSNLATDTYWTPWPGSYRGAHSSTARYQAGDVVDSGGLTYIGIGASTWAGSTLPPPSANWRQLTGPQGPAGAAGAAGPAGPAGATGPTAVWINPGAPPAHEYLWVDSDEPDATSWKLPRTKMLRSAALTIPGTGAWTKIPLDATSYDDGQTTMADTTNGRINIPIGGLYDIKGLVGIAGNATGIRGLAVYKNGVQALSGTSTVPGNASNTTFLPVVGSMKLVAGDYLELWAWQTSTVSLAVSTAGEAGTNLSAELIGNEAMVLAGPPLVTVLPVTPTDGQEVYFTPGANLGAWHLRYNAALNALDGYGWVFLGGAPLYNAVDAPENTSTSANYVDLTTVGPQVTVPLAGYYRITGGAYVGTATTVGSGGRMAIKLGAAAIADSETVMFLSTPAAAANASQGSREMRKTLAANDVLKAQYKALIAATVQFAYRWLEATPERVKA